LGPSLSSVGGAGWENNICTFSLSLPFPIHSVPCLPLSCIDTMVLPRTFSKPSRSRLLAPALLQPALLYPGKPLWPTPARPLSAEPVIRRHVCRRLAAPSTPLSAESWVKTQALPPLNAGTVDPLRSPRNSNTVVRIGRAGALYDQWQFCGRGLGALPRGPSGLRQTTPVSELRFVR